MKLIDQKAELLPQPKCLEEVYKQIELCGRTCYKSENKITKDSAKGFVDRMVKSNHTAMLEHGTVYLHLQINVKNCTSTYDYPEGGFTAHYNWSDVVGKIYANYRTNPYSMVIYVINGTKNSPIYDYYITTNYRVLIENGWLNDLKFICEPTEHHEKRYTFKLTTDRGVSHELVRHRHFSFAQESSRYCNYSKNKFGKELTFIIPDKIYRIRDEVASTIDSLTGQEKVFLKEYVGEALVEELTIHSRDISAWYDLMKRIEEDYMYLIEDEWTAQDARSVLPNTIKTEICMTGFESDWKHFFNLRYYGTTGAPHPDMKSLTSLMIKELNNNYEKN